MCIDHTHTGSMQRSMYFFDPWSVWKRPPCIAIATSSKLDLVIHSLVSLILSLPQLIHYNNRRRLTGYHDNISRLYTHTLKKKVMFADFS